MDAGIRRLTPLQLPLMTRQTLLRRKFRLTAYLLALTPPDGLELDPAQMVTPPLRLMRNPTLLLRLHPRTTAPMTSPVALVAPQPED